MRLVVTSLALLFASLATAEVDTRYLPAFGDSRYEHFRSTVIGRDFHIFVRLPDDYDQSADTQYPTIYLLDGGVQFPMLSTYHWYLGLADEVPDAIIVGISYGAIDFTDGNYRSTDFTAPAEDRDYWGGAAKFRRFLGDELIPHIESNYRARDDRRIIFGQSLGGQFVLYTALTEPDLFWGHIASNPALHRNLAFFLQRHSSSRSASKVFVASGSLDEPRFRGPALEWMEHWSKIDDKPWQLGTMTLDGHTHLSAPPASFREGLAWLFADAVPPSDEIASHVSGYEARETVD